MWNSEKKSRIGLLGTGIEVMYGILSFFLAKYKIALELKETYFLKMLVY